VVSSSVAACCLFTYLLLEPWLWQCSSKTLVNFCLITHITLQKVIHLTFFTGFLLHLKCSMFYVTASHALRAWTFRKEVRYFTYFFRSKFVFGKIPLSVCHSIFFLIIYLNLADVIPSLPRIHMCISNVMMMIMVFSYLYSN
jgi:hypothetical protein